MRKIFPARGTRIVSRRLSREQGGFTMVEAIVTMAMAVTLFGATSDVLVQSLHYGSRTANIDSTLQTLRTALGTISIDVASASSVSYVSGKGFKELQITTGGSGAATTGSTGLQGSTYTITYDCYTTAGTCTRVDSNAATTTQTIVTGVQNADIFTLDCHSTTSPYNLVGLANPTVFTGCQNTSSADYVEVRLQTSTPCTGQAGNVASVSCVNGNIEVDGGVQLRNQS
jgi:type II secretory pathway pseudopilin PulG